MRRATSEIAGLRGPPPRQAAPGRNSLAVGQAAATLLRIVFVL